MKLGENVLNREMAVKELDVQILCLGEDKNMLSIENKNFCVAKQAIIGLEISRLCPKCSSKTTKKPT